MRASFDGSTSRSWNFRPIDNGCVPGTAFEAYFRHFDFGQAPPAHFVEIDAWKNLGLRPVIASSSRHKGSVSRGRKVFPYKFLLENTCPVRSQRHGETRSFRNQQPRWSPAEHAEVGHSQYQSRRHQTLGASRRTAALSLFDEASDEEFLVEQLSGVEASAPHQKARRQGEQAAVDPAADAGGPGGRGADAGGTTPPLAAAARHEYRGRVDAPGAASSTISPVYRVAAPEPAPARSRYGYLRPVYRALGLPGRQRAPRITGS